MTVRQWALIGFLSLLWGGSFFFIAIAGREVPPFTIALSRVAIGAAVLLAAALALGHKVPSTARAWRDFAVMGALANAIPFVLIAFAQTRITTGVASVLNASTPLWTVLIAHLFTTDDKASPQRVLGVAIGMAGVATLVGPAAFAGEQSGMAGMLAMLAGTLSYGFAALWGRRFRDTPAIVTSSAQLACSAAILAPFAVLIDHPWTLAAPSWATVAALAGLALLSTALGFVIFFTVMAEAGATNAMLVTLLVPVSATALGVLFLGEALTLGQIEGGLLIATALLVIDGRAWSWLRQRVAQ